MGQNHRGIFKHLAAVGNDDQAVIDKALQHLQAKSGLASPIELQLATRPVALILPIPRLLRIATDSVRPYLLTYGLLINPSDPVR